jgi:polyhydroxybutyrate depolymerase
LIARGIAIGVTVAALLAACSDDEPTKPAVVAARPSGGCQAAAVPAGETEMTLPSGGTLPSGPVARSYFRRVPPAVSEDKPLPLVVDLHGYSEGAAIHTKLSALGPFGDEHGFVTLTPQGLGTPVRWDTSLKGDDMSFIRDLLDETERTVCIDLARVFVDGLSNGALMTSSVGCAMADRVAAIAPVAGVNYPEGCKPARRVPVLAIHGTADQFIRYEGGLGESGLDLPAPDGSGRKLRDVVKPGDVRLTPIPKMVAAWARRDGCDPAPSTVKVASDVDRIDYHCPAGVDVQLYRVNGGGHAWPGSPFGPAIESIVGKTTTSISANEVIWQFFQRHPLPGKISFEL